MRRLRVMTDRKIAELLVARSKIEGDKHPPRYSYEQARAEAAYLEGVRSVVSEVVASRPLRKPEG